MICPTALALAISRAYGTCFPQRVTALLWFPCPECAKTYGRRMTICNVCGGLSRLAVLG